MLDTKKIIQLGLGIAIGMLAYHFIQKAMNKTTLGGETAGASGSKCYCGNGSSVTGCKRSCESCCGLAEKYPTFYD